MIRVQAAWSARQAPTKLRQAKIDASPAPTASCQVATPLLVHRAPLATTLQTWTSASHVHPMPCRRTRAQRAARVLSAQSPARLAMCAWCALRTHRRPMALSAKPARLVTLLIHRTFLSARLAHSALYDPGISLRVQHVRQALAQWTATSVWRASLAMWPAPEVRRAHHVTSARHQTHAAMRVWCVQRQRRYPTGLSARRVRLGSQ